MKLVFKFSIVSALFTALLSVTTPSMAAGGGDENLLHVDTNLSDKGSLQNGAAIFMNYCLSCHSAEYSRYNRVAKDLGISEENMKENLMFAADKVGELMKSTMPADDARQWFGVCASGSKLNCAFSLA